MLTVTKLQSIFWRHRFWPVFFLPYKLGHLKNFEKKVFEWSQKPWLFIDILFIWFKFGTKQIRSNAHPPISNNRPNLQIRIHIVDY